MDARRAKPSAGPSEPRSDWQPQPRSEWFLEPVFWDTFSSFMFTPSRLAAAAPEARDIAQALKLQPGERVLDLACGPGRHALELARAGLVVTGVDLNPGYLKRARRSARWNRLEVEFVQADMRTFVRADAFAGAFIAYLSFGYSDDPDDDRQILASAARSLRPGGRMLLETMAMEGVSRLRGRKRRKKVGEDTHVSETRYLIEQRRFEEAWTIIRPDGRRATGTFRIRLYLAEELRRLFEASGFADVTLHSTVAGAPYDPESFRLVAVGTRPA